MEYALEFFLIFILQFIGVGFAVLQKCLELDKKSPDDTFNDVFRMYWQSDKFTVFISALIVALDLVVHLIFVVYAPGVRDMVVTIPAHSLLAFLPDISVPYLVMSFLAAFLLGFFGQKLFYKILGKFEKKVIENLKLDQ